MVSEMLGRMDWRRLGSSPSRACGPVLSPKDGTTKENDWASSRVRCVYARGRMAAFDVKRLSFVRTCKDAV